MKITNLNNSPYFGVKVKFLNNQQESNIKNYASGTPYKEGLNGDLNMLMAFEPDDFIVIGLSNDAEKGRVMYAYNPKSNKLIKQEYEHSNINFYRGMAIKFHKLIDKLINEDLTAPDGFWGITDNSTIKKGQTISTLMKNERVSGYSISNPPQDHPIFDSII